MILLTVVSSIIPIVSKAIVQLFQLVLWRLGGHPLLSDISCEECSE
jgi:hypothetical protein